jgi:Zn-dependent protease with chaperone function
MNAGITDQRTRQLTERLLAAFDAPVPRIWKSPFYMVGLVLVAVLIVLLPVLYLGLIALTGYGVFYHALNDTEILSLPSGLHGRGLAGAMMLKMLGYFAPILLGVIVIIFMVKPLFARPARGERRLSFVRENEPVLFAFVEKLCEVVGAPPPRRIDVDCQINAAAGFRRGLLSFLGRDMVLHIGAPLVAGLTLRQFAGVLAHEFGHFSQGAGMRLTYVIGRVNGWFARVVYERDTWDMQLVELSGGGGWFSLLFLVARFFVWLTRWVLWVLMMAGHAISCTMLRQMEHDADRHEVFVCGSESFGSALRRLHMLLMGWSAAHSLVAQCWKERRLPENLPALVVAEADRLPPDARQQVEKAIATSRTGLLETHPADGARIDRARREDEPGVFRLEEPTAVLFADFDALCREVSYAYYQDLIGPAAGREYLMPMTDVDRRREVLDQTAEAARRYWTTLDFVVRPFRIDRYSPVFELSQAECTAKLKRARSALESAQQTIGREYGRLQELDRIISDGRQAECLLKAGFRIDPKEFGLKTSNVMEAQLAYHQAQRDRRAVEERLAKIEAVFAVRLEAALALLNCEPVAIRIKDSQQLRARSEQLLDVAAAFHRAEYLLTELRVNQNSLRAVENALSRGHEDQRVITAALKVLETQHRALTELRAVTREVPYPYEHATSEISVSQYAIGIVPVENDVSGMASAVSHALDCLLSLYLRVMGELAGIGEQVESAVGLKPISLAKETPDGPPARPS